MRSNDGSYSDLDLYDVKTSVNIKIACDINHNNAHHMELLQDFKRSRMSVFQICDGKGKPT